MPKLTYQFVNTVTETGRYFDSGTNLHLLVKNGSNGPRKYWIFRFTCQGKRRDKSFGSFPAVSLSRARNLAIDAKAELNKGNFLSESEEVLARDGLTFHQFTLDWIETNKGQWSSQKHYRQWISTMKQYVFPKFGEVLLKDIGTENVLEVLKPIWRSKTETATRIRERIERILSAAIARELKEGPNPASWNGHLQFLLPAPTKIKEVKHHASVPYAEVPNFYRWLSSKPSVSSEALRFLILTAARTSEVTGARWGEVEENVWTIPDLRMKSRRAHRIPLSKSALCLLDKLRQDAKSSGFIFDRNGCPLSNMAMLQLLKRMGREETVHGFRSSFRIWAAEKSGFSSDAAEISLAHVTGSSIERAYMRSDLLDLRRDLMEEWAKYVTGEDHDE